MLDNRAWTHVQRVKDDPHGLAPTNELEIKPSFSLPAICTLSKICCGCLDRGLGKIGEGKCTARASNSGLTAFGLFLFEGLVQSYDSGDAPRSISGDK